MFADPDVLRADFLALSAFDALICAGKSHGGNVELFPSLCPEHIIVKCENVHCGEGGWDTDVHRTDLCAVFAVRAGYQRIFGDLSLSPGDHLLLFCGKLLKILHIGDVVLHLINIAHTGKYREDPFTACGKADRP